MKRLIRALLAVAGVMMCGTTASGQFSVAAHPDARVRVELANGQVLTGRVASVDRDSLYLRAENAASARAIAMPFIRTLQLSAGRDRWRGARRGTLVTGVISLAAIGMAVYTDTRSRDAIIPSTLFVVPLGVVFTGLGTGVGAVAAPEKWSTRIAVGGAARGLQAQELRVGVRWEF
jgi:hypothetical protein